MGIVRFGKAAALVARPRLPLLGLCVLAAVMNILLHATVRNFLGLPVFLDTVFTATVAFAFGLVPGLFVAVLGWVIECVFYGHFHFFVICSVAEVLLICALKPAAPVIPYFAARESVIATYAGFAAGLMILYIVCAMAVSVLGGAIDYATQMFMGTRLNYFSPEDTFRPALVVAGLPLVVEDILARVPVNLVGRLIVVFGGYFASRWLLWVKRGTRRGMAGS